MISTPFWGNHKRLVCLYRLTNLRLGVGKMKSKNGLKRMTMTKGEDISFPELGKYQHAWYSPILLHEIRLN